MAGLAVYLPSPPASCGFPDSGDSEWPGCKGQGKGNILLWAMARAPTKPGTPQKGLLHLELITRGSACLGMRERCSVMGEELEEQF